MHALVKHERGLRGPNLCRSLRRAALGILPLMALLSLALPVASICPAQAPAAFAKKLSPKAKRAARKNKVSRQRASRDQQRERDLERARSRVIPIPDAATAVPRNLTAPETAPPPAPDPNRGTKPFTLQDKKAIILDAPPDVLKLVGGHVIVGYHAADQLTPLLERGAIGGVFVTARNAHRRTKASLASEIAGFRAKAAAAGRDAFWLATDQEGGPVSRLSPPLPYQPSLHKLLSVTIPEERREAVAAYAAKQSKALAELGINLNFAPVADINHNVRAPRDRHTRIRSRAISADPAIVSSAARTYCAELAKAGVHCTLKHFPGIGRIAADTHVTSARLDTARDVLAETDWVPFREVISASPAFVMIGHPHVQSLDKTRPASTSPAVIQRLLRDSWGFQGVIVTDDLAMGAITRHVFGGMAAAAVDAINAGADLVLIGSDGDEVYDVLYALIEAHEQGRLDSAKLAASDKRLKAAAAELTRSARITNGRDPAPPASKTTTARQ